MENEQLIASIAALLFFAMGTAVFVLLPRMHRRAPRRKRRKQGDTGAFEETCRACHKIMVLHANTIVPLSALEKGLVVSASPDLRGQPLGRFICPYCDSAHYFIKERGRYRFAGMNFYEPQQRGALCAACQKPLKAPPWPEGTYDGHIEDATITSPDYGLICSRCHAVSCVACCEAVTKGNDRAQGYRCPRCSRRPIDRFFQP